MKRLDIVSEESKMGTTPLYYSIAEDAVYTTPADGRWHLTDLIRHNTEDEIEETVKRFMRL